MATQLEALIDDEIGISPSSVCAVCEPSGASVYWALCAGFAHYPNASQSDVCTQLYMDVLEILLDRDIPVDMRLADETPGPGGSKTIAGRTALMYASSAGSVEAVRRLIREGANVNLRDHSGVTPLMLACAPASKVPLERRLEVATVLIDEGAHLDMRDIAGQTALMNACSRIQVPLVKLLLESGADVTLRHGKGSTAVGVLAAGLGTDGPQTASDAQASIDACVAASPSGDARRLLLEELKAARFFDLHTSLMPTHNKWIATPRARNGDREAALVGQICGLLGLSADFLTRELPSQEGGRWGNFYEEIQRRLTARIPQAFLRIYGEHPTSSDFALLTQFSSEAIDAAHGAAERLSRERYGGVRTSAYDPETLQQECLVPYRHRGRVPRCMKDYQNLFVLPLRRCISHAVPSTHAIKALAKLGPVVEMGAGSGYWSAMLLERKVDVLAYDIDPPNVDTLSNGFAYRQFCDVRKGDSSLFTTDASLAARTLLLVWPGQFDEKSPHESPHEEIPSGWEAECLSEYMKAGGQTVVYVGEREESVTARPGTAPDCGVSASKAFQVMLRTKFTLAEQHDVPSLFFTCDDMTVWKRK